MFVLFKLALRIRRRRASDQHWPYNSNSIEDAELFCDGGRRNRLVNVFIRD